MENVWSWHAVQVETRTKNCLNIEIIRNEKQ